jgi:heme/copper-type cytochrome/quinol oxidase subunit 4
MNTKKANITENQMIVIFTIIIVLLVSIGVIWFVMQKISVIQ